MGIFEFFFVACLSTHSDLCRKIDGPIFAPEITWSQCMLEGPAITAAWAMRNPDEVVREWSCRPVSPKPVSPQSV